MSEPVFCARRIRWLASALGAWLLALPATAHAQSDVRCVTRVTAVGVNTSGWLAPTMPGLGTPFLCSIAYTANIPGIGNVSPDLCRGWLSMLLTAKTTGQDVALTFTVPGGPPPANWCETRDFQYVVPSPAPYFLVLMP